MRGGGRRDEAKAGVKELLALVFLYNSSASLYNNMVPLLVVSLGLGPLAVSLASFLINTVFIVLSPHSGRTGDTIGRKPLLILGVLLIMSSQAILVAERSYDSVLLSAMLAGAAGALFSVNATMAVVELGSLRNMRPERPLASLGLASGGGWFTGMLLGGRLMRIAGFRETALLGLSLSAISMLLALIVPRTPVLLERAVTAKPSMFFLGVVERVRLVFAYITSLRRPISAFRGFVEKRFNAYITAMMLAFLSVSLFFTQIPVYMKLRLGLSNGEVFTYLSIHSGVSTLTFTALYGAAASMVSMDKLLEAALAVRAVAFTLPLLLSSLPPILMSLATFIATGATWSMISVSMNSVALELAEPARRGEKIGQLNSATSLGILLGSILSGVIADTLGFAADFLAASALMALSFLAVSRILGGRSRGSS